MSMATTRVPALVALAGSALGLIFAAYSTLDYAAHLDRRLHDVHCSFIPGVAATSEAEACRAAMYSPYSALLKEELWGGVPISLFALGAFAFLAAFAVYLLVEGKRAPKQAVGFFGLVSVTPLLVSLAMLTISLTQLGSLCKTCVGLYVASFLTAVGGIWGLFALTGRNRQAAAAEGSAHPSVSPLFPAVWLVCMGLVTLTPAIVYANGVPDHSRYLEQCGKLKAPADEADRLITMRTPQSIQPTLLFEDPLCPTCKAFHERLVAESVFDKLDVQMVMFPLDNSCNWMLDQPLHPGACTISKAVLCGRDRARDVLEWAFDNQEMLAAAGKAGDQQLRARLSQRWGQHLLPCIDSRETTTQLNQHLHFAAENSIPVSTPQMYLGSLRVCDEDTDIGLRYTLKKLAPEVLK